MATVTKSKIKSYQPRECADENQRNVYKHFTAGSYLSDPKNADHVYLWLTFFRRNLHRLATDYLGIHLHLYQVIILFFMGICQKAVIIASRAAAKSFIIALYACCRCIVRPRSLIVLASATKGQAELIVSEKIETELMNMSSVLRSEIKKIVKNQRDTYVIFKNGSMINVVPALDSQRGRRSTCLIREEFRQIDKSVEDKVLSPFQVTRQASFLTLPDYAGNKSLIEEPVNIFISSSWIDNGHWMWKIVDDSFTEMLDDELSCLLAFDESITLKHNIRTMKQLQQEKKKLDPLTWRIEYLNERVKEDEHAFFSYSMLSQNQRAKKAFYPRFAEDVRNGRKNPYDIPKQPGEIRIVACDMAFVENKANDNSIFSCMRLLPETKTYNSQSNGGELEIDSGYRRIVPYLESIQGGDTTKQAVRIRELYEDFNADYIVLDLRNAGISIYDMLAKVMYDEDRDMEYSPLSCMNDDSVANRIQIEGANPCIFVINATQKLNSDIAMDFKRVLMDKKIDLLIGFEAASEEILPKIKEYVMSPDADGQAFFEAPYLETQALINETTSLVYEKKEQTGIIVIHEKGANRKDRYTSVSYASYFASLLEKDLMSQGSEYEYHVFVN